MRRRSKRHWPGDLVATVIVLTVAGVVFWLVPPPTVPSQWALQVQAQSRHSV